MDYTQGIDLKDVTGGYAGGKDLMFPHYQDSRELNMRDGLPNILYKLKSGKNVTIAYVGGSITLQQGWRVKSLEWLRRQYPLAHIREVNGAINGTGSDLAAARLSREVLQYSPDLVFIEFAVNDGGIQEETILKSMEGVVRQIWRKDPETDICFVYTIKNGETRYYQKDSTRCQPTVEAHEKVAAHYGIPSVNLGPITASLEEAGELVFKGNAEIKDKIIFSMDGVHPVDAGDRLYAGAVARSILKLEHKALQPARHVLKEPLHEGNWEKAKTYEFIPSMFKGSWEKIISEEDPYLQYAKSRNLFHELWRSDTPGDRIEISFEGTAIGLYDIGGPASGQLSVVIDNQPPIIVNRFTVYNDHIRHQYFYLSDMGEGVHTVSFELLPQASDKGNIIGNKSDFLQNPGKYQGNAVYAGKILIVGTLI